MKKLLNIITLFLGCRLGWIWFQTCGNDLGMGETLPFCLECVPLATVVRLLILGIVIWSIYKLLQEPPVETTIIEKEFNPVQMLRIHWHRIFILIALLSYWIWIDWLDINTTIPSPHALFLTRAACGNDGVKGTYLWAINMLFVAIGFRILHKTKEN